MTESRGSSRAVTLLHGPRSARSRLLWSTALFVGVLLVVLQRIPYGFSLMDEAFALASAERYVLGDVPFKDEAFTVFRSSDLLIAVLMHVLPWDTVLLWRVIGFGIQLACLAAAALFLRRHIPFLPLTLLLAALAFYTPFNIWTPQYANVATLIVLASTSLWLHYAESASFTGRAVILGSGLLLSLCSFLYTPLLGLLLVPVALLAVPTSIHCTTRVRPSSCLYVAGACAGTALFTIALLQSGLLPDLINSLHEAQSASVGANSGVYSYQSGVVEALAYRVRVTGSRTIVAMVSSFVVLGAAGFLSTRCWWSHLGQMASRGGALICLGLAVLQLWVAPDPDRLPTLSPQFSFLTFGVVGLAVGWMLGCWRSGETVTPPVRSERTVVLAFGLVGLLASLIMTLTSANGLAEFNVGMWLLWPAAIALMYTFTPSPETADIRVWTATLRMGTLIAILSAALFHLYSWTYFDEPIPRLTAEFSLPKLQGVRSTPERVEEIEGLVSAIQASGAERGSRLLSYGQVTGLTYLTDTRPATRSSWIRSGLPSDEVMAAWIRRMVESKRVPALVVVRGEIRQANPMERFIAENYYAVFSTGDLTLWRHQ